VLDTKGAATTVHVWTVEPFDGDLDPWIVHLSAVEQERAAGLPAHQASRFVLARVLLRGVLGARLDCAARAVPLHVRCPDCGGAHGPITCAWSGAPFVSVTRAGPLIGVALTDAGPVGIDIESHAAAGAAPFADVALPRRELSVHSRLRPRARTHALVQFWVIAEAVLKATGTGLRADPAGLEVERAGGRGMVRTPDGTQVRLVELDLGPTTAGAVAVVSDGSGGPGRGVLGAPAPARLAVRLLDGAAVLGELRHP
jgi:4'-phosphopantetheinyl transferase